MEYWLNAGFIELGELTNLARAAEDLGYTGIAMPDHLFFPKDIKSEYPYSSDGAIMWPAKTPWADPWVAVGAMAAVTSTLRFSTGVQIAPLRDPFSLAKAVSTAHELSSGRIRCGFGVGWLREEFDVVGVDFSTRGRRMDELLDVMKLLWTGEVVRYEGEFFNFQEISMLPAALDVQIHIGGNSQPALRRAARHDGWLGSYDSPESTAKMIKAVTDKRAEVGRLGEPFHVGLTGPSLINMDSAELTEAGVSSVTYPILGLGRTNSHQERITAIERQAQRVGL